MNTNLKQQALEFDNLDDPVNASRLYEAWIKSHLDRECYINLLLIYFESNDLGYSNKHNLSKDFIENAWDRLFSLLGEAKEKYPSIEVKFWENYIQFMLIGESPFNDLDTRFANQSESIVPFFYFYDKKKHLYAKEAGGLLQEVKDEKTCKERYIKSILDAKMMRG